jgi:hypothetical protein
MANQALCYPDIVSFQQGIENNVNLRHIQNILPNRADKHT